MKICCFCVWLTPTPMLQVLCAVALSGATLSRRVATSGAAALLFDPRVSSAAGPPDIMQGGLSGRLKVDLALVDACKAAKLSAPGEAERSPDKLLAIARGVYKACTPLRAAILQGAPIGRLDVVALFEVGPDPKNFEPTLQRALVQFDPSEYVFLVWLEGTSSPGAVPWCPDTQAVLPMLARELYGGRGVPIVLLTANVLREELQQTGYAYRADSRLRLTGVPALYRWGSSEHPTGRLACASTGCAEWEAANAIAALIEA